MPEPSLRTMDDLAASLGLTSAKTARRHLVRAMEKDPSLRAVLRGRTLLLTPDMMARVLRALEWRSPSADVERPGTRAALSVLGRRPSPSASSALDAGRELMLKRLGRTKKPESERSTSKGQPVGRAASP